MVESIHYSLCSRLDLCLISLCLSKKVYDILYFWCDSHSDDVNLFSFFETIYIFIFLTRHRQTHGRRLKLRLITDGAHQLIERFYLIKSGVNNGA